MTGQDLARRPARWLRGRLYGRADLPRRWTWLLVFAGCYSATSWIGGRIW